MFSVSLPRKQTNIERNASIHTITQRQTDICSASTFSPVFTPQRHHSEVLLERAGLKCEIAKLTTSKMRKKCKFFRILDVSFARLHFDFCSLKMRKRENANV